MVWESALGCSLRVEMVTIGKARFVFMVNLEKSSNCSTQALPYPQQLGDPI